MEDRKVPGRTPDAAPPARMAPLDTLPVFFRAQSRRALVVGGGEPAAWKAELLAAAGARVQVVAPQFSAAMREVAERAHCELVERDWRPDDLAGAICAICDARDETEARSFLEAARARGVPANCIDKPGFSDFQFGAIVNRSPLVIGISTGGAAPVFGQALRARIETIAPAPFAAWAKAAREWRADIAARGLPFRARRKFWEMFAALAFARPADPPRDDDRAALVAQALSPEAQQGSGRGRVLLVGAGPGDPELLTLRAVRALQSADVVMFDDLVSPAILDMARREAERVNVGKRGYKPSCGQDEISSLLVRMAGEGKLVVRLKGGDPLIFGRANEEIDALEAAGVAVEVIPGITAASGAAASLLASLTERDLARRVQFVTAHARDGKLPADLNWAALCDPNATTAVYMGVHTMPEFVAGLIAGGLSPDTPAILVERATSRDQREIVAAIATMPAAAAAAAPTGPCLLLIGRALARPAERLEASRKG